MLADRQAELCAEFLGMGWRTAIDGPLKSRSWGRWPDVIRFEAPATV